MRNTEQTIRDPIKLKSRAHRLPGCLIWISSCEAVCSCTALQQNSCGPKGMSVECLLGFCQGLKKFTPLCFQSVVCFFLVYSEIETSGKPIWSSAKLGFLFCTWWLHFRNLCGQTRQDVLSLLSLHVHHVFALSCGCSYTRKIRIWKLQLFNCMS